MKESEEKKTEEPILGSELNNIKNDSLKQQSNEILTQLVYSFDGDNYYLGSNDEYDLEHKPKEFKLLIHKKNDSKVKFYAIVDLFRLIKLDNQISEHYYKTQFLEFEVGNDISKNSIDIDKMLDDNRSRFLKTFGFSFHICLTSKKVGLVKSKSSDCSYVSNIEISY